MSEILLAAFLGILFLLYGIGVPAAYSLAMTVLLIMFLPIGPELNFVVVTQRFWSGSRKRIRASASPEIRVASSGWTPAGASRRGQLARVSSPSA